MKDFAVSGDFSLGRPSGVLKGGDNMLLGDHYIRFSYQRSVQKKIYVSDVIGSRDRG